MNRIKGQLTTADYLPIEEFNRLVDSLHDDRLFLWELYCRLSFCTALRASDVLSLKWVDILEKDRLVRKETKTGKSREIILNHSVREKFSELYVLLGKPNVNTYVILNPRTKRTYSLEYINLLLKTFRVKYRLSIEHFSSHTFRKTFGRYVYEKNGKTAESLILLSTIFKHTNIETTKVYIGIRKTEINRVFNSIEF